MALMAWTMAQPIRWVNETLPPRARARWLLITTRLSNSSLTGIARTLVAVGTARLASMFWTVRAAAPLEDGLADLAGADLLGWPAAAGVAAAADAWLAAGLSRALRPSRPQVRLRAAAVFSAAGAAGAAGGCRQRCCRSWPGAGAGAAGLVGGRLQASRWQLRRPAAWCRWSTAEAPSLKPRPEEWPRSDRPKPGPPESVRTFPLRATDSFRNQGLCGLVRSWPLPRSPLPAKC